VFFILSEFIFLLLVFYQFLNERGVFHCKWIPVFVIVLSVPVNHNSKSSLYSHVIHSPLPVLLLLILYTILPVL